MAVGTSPLLSICVPTFNRAEPLRALLMSIASQPYPLDYEVLVQDNASTDATEDVCRAFIASHGTLRFARNPKNLGGKANIRLCTTEAKGRYIWVVGSDDQLLPDAFSVLSHITAQADAEDALACLAHSGLRRRFGRLSVVHPRLSWLRDVSINVPAFISSVVWNARFWQQYPYEETAKTLEQPHLHCFLKASVKGPVLGWSRDLVTVGHAESAARPDYWFYPSHAIVDCFEYPVYYQQALSDAVDRRTRVFIVLRWLALLRHVATKAAFLRHNDAYYGRVSRRFHEAHGRAFYWPALRPLLWLLLESRAGHYVARLANRGHEKLAAGTRP